MFVVPNENKFCFHVQTLNNTYLLSNPLKLTYPKNTANLHVNIYKLC